MQSASWSTLVLQFKDQPGYIQLGVGLARLHTETAIPVESTSLSMDLNTITEVAHPQTREQLPVWTAGDAWLAGGTWLFSEPQAHLTRLIDLTDFKWPALTVERNRPDDRRDLHRRAARCIALPAGMDRLAADRPMLPRVPRLLQDLEDRDRRRQSLHVVAGRPDDRADRGARWRLHDLEGRRQRAARSASPISSPATSATCWQPGDLLRQIEIPVAALTRRSAFRQISLTPVGRSAALLIGSAQRRRRSGADGDGIDGAAGSVLLCRDSASRANCATRSCTAFPMTLYHDDVHGKPAWRKHMTLRLAEEIRGELQGAPRR